MSQTATVKSLLLMVAFACLWANTLALGTINIWKHRYPFYGGYGYFPWGGYGGYGGGYGGISIGGGGGGYGYGR